MDEKKSHLSFSKNLQAQNYSPARGRNPNIPIRDRNNHGQKIISEYSLALESYDSLKSSLTTATITEETGIYIELIGFPNQELPINNLDTIRNYQLRSLKKVDDTEIAILFIPESQRSVFSRKIGEYLNPDKDGNNAPRNHALVNSIQSIRLAEVESFWTDPLDNFPALEDEEIWWELWLKKRVSKTGLNETAYLLAERIGAQLASTSIDFFDSSVILIKTSIEKIKNAPILISNLQELRAAKDSPYTIVDSNSIDQNHWAENLAERLEIDEHINTVVTILDSGVNYDHPLLKFGIDSSLAECWEPTWAKYDTYALTNPNYNHHGSLQAGLILFHDLQEKLLANNTHKITYGIESGRILPPNGSNDPELYGDITTGTASKLIINNPNLKRVFSLAVTSDCDVDSGLPSSWSANIDQYSMGLSDENPKLFIISTGNNRDIQVGQDYWDQVLDLPIEDPAQSWNALSVGSYTEITNIEDEDYADWTPLAEKGDISPAARSSHNWSWKKYAPYKPEIVAEGGNRIISPDKSQISDATDTSLLTTSGRASGQLFEVTRDSSASCAIVSSFAAQLMTEYPSYWPETIRALLVHSASWNEKMHQRYVFLLLSHTPVDAKEIMLRTFGYGVPDIDRARYSASNQLTLVAENTLQPYAKKADAPASTDPSINEMHLYEIPWPVQTLLDLGQEVIKLNVTLSYFIEPNPSRRGYRTQFSYQSHGLRFEVIRPGQTLNNFQSFINRGAPGDDYDGPEGTVNGWKFGKRLRSKGSIHSDEWEGSAADLADMRYIAVHPVSGWWKYKQASDRWQNKIRYSLIVSIDAPDIDIDIYSEIEQSISAQIQI